MLDFRTETFLTVCDQMSYTKASEILNTTQPAISGHIKTLENYYNTKLFTYENRKLSLTPQGESLRRALQTFVHDEKKLKNELMQIKEKRVYRVGATRSIGDYYLPKLLSGYLAKHEDVELSVTVANTANLLDMIDHGNLDIVLTEGNFSKDQYEYHLIREEPFSVFCGRDYDVGTIEKIEDLFRHRIISREEGSGTREVFERYLMERGFSISNFAHKCCMSSLKLITEMIAADQGIGVLYRCVGKDLLKEGKLREIHVPGFELTHAFNALWQKNSIYGSENEKFLEELIKR